MQTKSYSALFSEIEALAGVDFTSSETPRIKSLINRRARIAWDACEYWPRFLVVGEERQLSNSTVPYTEGALDNIGHFIQIHKEQPFVRNSVKEYNFYVTSAGAYVTDLDTSATSVYVTYQKQLTDTYGDGDGEETSVPLEWYDYIAHGTFADFLRFDEQNEKAFAEESIAQKILDEEMMNVDRQHTHQIVGRRIFTHTNNQGRQY